MGVCGLWHSAWWSSSHLLTKEPHVQASTITVEPVPTTLKSCVPDSSWPKVPAPQWHQELNRRFCGQVN